MSFKALSIKFIVFALCLFTFSCQKDSNIVSSSAENTAIEVMERGNLDVTAIIMARRTDKKFADSKLANYYLQVFKENPKTQVIGFSKELDVYLGINIRVSNDATILRATECCEKCPPNGSTTLIKQPNGRSGLVVVETRGGGLAEVIARICQWAKG
jgi:hypothetical protein